jgi:Flp pilus assembly pilin Flp
MFRLLKSKTAQTTAEYAILIGLVIAALVAMQVYVKRGLQGRMRSATDYLAAQTLGIGNTSQYEPYYLSSDFNTTRDAIESEATAAGGSVTRTLTSDTSTRTGTQSYSVPE